MVMRLLHLLAALYLAFVPLKLCESPHTLNHQQGLQFRVSGIKVVLCTVVARVALDPSALSHRVFHAAGESLFAPENCKWHKQTPCRKVEAATLQPHHHNYNYNKEPLCRLLLEQSEQLEEQRDCSHCSQKDCTRYSQQDCSRHQQLDPRLL